MFIGKKPDTLLVVSGANTRQKKFLERMSHTYNSLLEFEEFLKTSLTFQNISSITLHVFKPQEFSMEDFNFCLDRLRPGGYFYIYGYDDSIPTQYFEELETNLMFAGFIDIRISPASNPSEPFYNILCQKPQWEMGHVASIELDDTIDENALFFQADGTYQTFAKEKSNCSSKPRACANCSCGRAELERQYGAEEAKNRLESGNIKSSCGSCFKGDAFRCSSCPYKGLPAFQPGEKVLLDMDRSNTGQMETNENDTIRITSGNKVTLQV